MDVLLSAESLARNINSIYMALLPATALLGAVAIYGPHIFEVPEVHIEPQSIGQFTFQNGLLLPHKQFLYASSSTGEAFIMGHKLAGHDYTAWEAAYKDFPRLESLSVGSSGLGTTYSWSFKDPKVSISMSVFPLLLWFMIAVACSLLLGFAVRKIINGLSNKTKNKKEVLAAPSNDIEAEYWKLNDLWRRNLISMYREQKNEVVSLSKLAVFYYESCRNLTKSSAEENRQKDEAKCEVARLEAEKDNADKTIEDLRQRFAVQSTRSQQLEAKNQELEAQNTTAKETVTDLEERVKNERARLKAEKDIADKTIEELRQMSEAQATGLQQLEANNNELEVQNTTAKETITGLEERVKELQAEEAAAASIAEDVGTVETLGSREEDENSASKQDEESPADDVQEAAGSTTEDMGTAATLSSTDENKNNATKQGEKPPANDDQDGKPILGLTGKPLKIRKNKRSDGTIRTQGHPGYVPSKQAQSELGDRPFSGSGPGRGNSENQERGSGRGGGRGRRGYVGWIGGRGVGGGGRGGAGAYGGYGQSNRGGATGW